jgi:hypothetical protein
VIDELQSWGCISSSRRVLRDADLVMSTRKGREVVFQVRSEQLLATASWMRSLAASWDDRLAALKERAEAPTRD